MKFQLHCLGFCLIFYTLRSRTSKSIGNNTMKKNATPYCAGPAYLQDVLNRRLLFKTNRQQ